MGGRAGRGLDHKHRPDSTEFSNKYEPEHTKFSNQHDNHADYDNYRTRVGAVDQFSVEFNLWAEFHYQSRDTKRSNRVHEQPEQYRFAGGLIDGNAEQQ